MLGRYQMTCEYSNTNNADGKSEKSGVTSTSVRTDVSAVSSSAKYTCANQQLALLNGVVVSVYNYERHKHVTISFEKKSLKRLSIVRRLGESLSTVLAAERSVWRQSQLVHRPTLDADRPPSGRRLAACYS